MMLDWPEFKRHGIIVEHLQSDSDAGVALTAAAYAEEKLRQAIESRFVQSNLNQSGLAHELFGGQGALATFFAKIHLAYALGLLVPNHSGMRI